MSPLAIRIIDILGKVKAVIIIIMVDVCIVHEWEKSEKKNP